MVSCGEESTPAPLPATPTVVAPAAPAPPVQVQPTAAPTQTPSPPPAATPKVTSVIQDFTLEDITVPVGTTVEWVNNDSVAHTSSSGSPAQATDVWDSGSLSRGGSYSFTFNQEGTFAYFCKFHPAAMTSTVTVGAQPAAAAISQEPALSPTPTATAMPTETRPPPTLTAVPPTTAAVSASPTAVQPTATHVPPTATPPLPTATAVPPTATPLPTPVPPTATATTVPGAALITSNIRNSALESLTVPVGTKVTWENKDAFPHTSTSGTRASPTGIWGSEFLDQGQKFSFTFKEPGTFAYFCALHSGMQGTITVTEP